MSEMNRQILHIDLDAFFVSVERALNPELRGKPVVVGGHRESRGVVSCASYEARAFGLHAAMPISTAYRLCPQAVFISGKFENYRDYSARFMAILADFSPDMKPGGLDEAWLDLTGFEPLYGPVFQTGRRIKERVSNELGIVASVGIAPSKIVAKVASDFCKPDGLIEVPPGTEKAFLAPMPVKDLPGVGTKTQQTLHRFGVKTIGQLAELSISFLKKHFGVYGETLHRHANGIDQSRISTNRPAKSISRETTLTKDSLDERFLKATLRQLSERVGADLRHQEKQARCVTFKLRYADFETLTRNKTLRTSTELDQVIFTVGADLMDKALLHRRHPVRLIGIGVSQLTNEAFQLDLLDDSIQKQLFLNKEIDRIRRKYGFRAIETGQTFPLNRSEDDL